MDYLPSPYAALRSLILYSDPGNVRELENIAQRAVTLARSCCHHRELLCY
jgi:transcriptional regulator with GAF, ATPase, and Fis domain